MEMWRDALRRTEMMKRTERWKIFLSMAVKGMKMTMMVMKSTHRDDEGGELLS